MNNYKRLDNGERSMPFTVDMVGTEFQYLDSYTHILNVSGLSWEKSGLLLKLSTL